jgi:hypothetical protein
VISTLRLVVTVLLVVLAGATTAAAADPPRLVSKDGRWALLVDGKPFLMLGGQVHNSSAWPSELPQIWESLKALNANTLEAPIYWEQVEPQPGQFDWTCVDAIVMGAREHGFRVVFAWFGTWKNGNMHYVPQWVKTDTKRYPRVVRPDGEVTDILSPISRNSLEADKAAFVQVMRHLKAIDDTEHTVLMVQVENESGNVGSVRDFSPEANALFAKDVPADMLAATKKTPGAWREVYGGEADEIFQAYHQAKYIEEIAAAGKKEFAIPLYTNAWLSYPPSELPERRIPMPGIQYPSGGPVQKYVGLWRALAPSLDLIAPDIYSDDTGFVRDVLAAYALPTNALMIPEIGKGDSFAKVLFAALGKGAIGFAPFGIDKRGWNILGNSPAAGHARAFGVVRPIGSEVARLNFEGKVKTAVEESGQPSQEIDFGPWQVTAAFGFPQYDGRRPPGTKDAHGAALVAQLGPDEFLVTGIDAAVFFHRPGRLPGMRIQYLSVEEGTYEDGVWVKARLWNGDETDRGLQFPADDLTTVRVKIGTF